MESPKSTRKNLGQNIAGSPRQTRKVPGVPQHVKDSASSPKTRRTVNSSPEGTRRRRISVPILPSEYKPTVVNKSIEDWKESPRKESPRKDKLVKNNGELFEVHYVEAARIKSDKDNEFKSKPELKVKEGEADNDSKMYVGNVSLILISFNDFNHNIIILF